MLRILNNEHKIIKPLKLVDDVMFIENLKTKYNLTKYLSFKLWRRKAASVRYRESKFTIVVGKDAAQTPSRLSVRSSTPDATT